MSHYANLWSQNFVNISFLMSQNPEWNGPLGPDFVPNIPILRN